MSSRHRSTSSSQHHSSAPRSLHPSSHHSSHHSGSGSGSRSRHTSVARDPSRHTSVARDPSHHSSVVRDASRHTSAAPSGVSRPSHTRRRSQSLPSRSHAGSGSNTYIGAPSVYNPVLSRRLSGGLTPEDSISQIASSHRDAPRSDHRSASSHSRARTIVRAIPSPQMVAQDVHVAPSRSHNIATVPATYLAPAHVPPVSQLSPHMSGTGAPVQYVPATASTVYHTAHGVSYVPYHSVEAGGQRFTFAYPVDTANIAPHLSPRSTQHYARSPPRVNHTYAPRSPPRFVQNDFPRANASSEYSSMSSGSGRIGPRDEPDVAHDSGNRGIWSKVRKMFVREPGSEREMADAHARTTSGSRRSRSVVRSPQYEFRNPGRRNRSR